MPRMSENSAIEVEERAPLGRVNSVQLPRHKGRSASKRRTCLAVHMRYPLSEWLLLVMCPSRLDALMYSSCVRSPRFVFHLRVDANIITSKSFISLLVMHSLFGRFSDTTLYNLT